MTGREPRPRSSDRRLASAALIAALIGPALLLVTTALLLVSNEHQHDRGSSFVSALLLGSTLLCALATPLAALAAVALGATALWKSFKRPLATAGRETAVAALALGLVQAILLAFAALWFGTLVASSIQKERARPPANESAALDAMRARLRAEMLYAQVNAGRFGAFECLAGPRQCLPNYAGPPFLDIRTAPSMEGSGYTLDFLPCGSARDVSPGAVPRSALTGFAMLATPSRPSRSARRLCGDSTGLLCALPDGARLTSDGLCPASCAPLERIGKP